MKQKSKHNNLICHKIIDIYFPLDSLVEILKMFYSFLRHLKFLRIVSRNFKKYNIFQMKFNFLMIVNVNVLTLKQQ